MKFPRLYARLAFVVATSLELAACGAAARMKVEDGMGPRPTLPPPKKTLLPTINVVTAKGWTDGAAPVAAPGTKAVAFARGLQHPRWLCVLPNGDVLVAETNAPPRPDDNKGIKGYFFKRFQKKAGGAVPSANRITLLRDADARPSGRSMPGPDSTASSRRACATRSA
jgi:glucose/arabinose dehydrogenase